MTTGTANAFLDDHLTTRLFETLRGIVTGEAVIKPVRINHFHIVIEDTELPQPYGETKQRLLSLDEGIGKMKAAMAAKEDPALCIAGRTSAVAIAGLDEGVKRAKAYEQCGVDALFMVGVTTRAEVDAISEATTLPLILGGSTPDLEDLDYLSARVAEK